MIKALTEIVSVDIGENLVSMSIVQKQNESGFKFNERLFIVVHGVFFGYISKVKLNEQPSTINIADAKVKIPMKNLFSIEVQAETMIIKFTIQEGGKLVPKEWVLKTASQKLATFWKQLLEYELKMRNKSPPPKKQTSSSIPKETLVVNQPPQDKKDSASPSKIVEPREQRNEKPKQQLKKQTKAAKVFENPLFDDNDSQESERGKKKSRQSSVKKPIQMQKSRIEKQKGKEQVNRANKISESKQARSSEVKEIKDTKQTNVEKLIDQVKVQKRVQQPKKKELTMLKLQRIDQQPIEQTPNNKNQQLRKVQPKNLFKPESRFERSTKKQIKPQQKGNIPQRKSPQKFELGIRQSQFINGVLKELQEKNKKFPFQQLTYSHEDVERIVKTYGKDLKEATNENNKTEELLNYIIEAQRAKLEKAAPKGKASESAPWMYKQIVQDEQVNLLNFKTKCKSLMKTLYADLQNKIFHTFVQVRKERTMLIYNVEDIEVRVPLIIHKQAMNGQMINLLDESPQKKILKEYQAFKYFYKVVGNQGKIRVPYSCVCEYGGLLAFFKAKAEVSGDKEKATAEIGEELMALQRKTKLPLATTLKGKLRCLDQFHYNELRSGDKTEFKFYVPQQLSNLFTVDSSQQLNVDDLDNSILRGIENQPRLADQLAKRVKKLVYQLEGGEFYFIAPNELAGLFHQQGLSLRYLRDAYLKINDPFMKSILASEIVARSIKSIFRKTMQDECFQMRQPDLARLTEEDYSYKLKDKCIDFLNCIFGGGGESQAIWQLILANSQHKWGVKVERHDVSKGQLVVSTAHHCGLLLNWQLIDVQKMFTNNSFLAKESLRDCVVKVKSYEPIECGLHLQLHLKMKDIAHQNFTSIVNQLKLKQSKFPKELQLYPNLVRHLKVFLSNFIEPEQVDWSNNYSHLGVYEWQQPSRMCMQTEISMLRWYLRSGRRQKYLNKFNELSSKIARIYGNHHPFLSQMYELFSNYHKAKGQVEDSINFSKSALLNYSALYGDNHFKVAQSYYKLASLLLSYGRQSQAEEHLRKAKQIIDNIKRDKSLLQGKVRLQLALIAFKEEKHKECLSLLQGVSEVFDAEESNPNNNYESQRTQVYQLSYLCQAKENLKAENNRLCTHLEAKLKSFGDHNNYAEILWILIDFYMNSISPQSKQTMKNLIQMIPTKHSITFYKKSYQLLQKRQAQRKLFQSFKKYSGNATKIVDMIVQKNLLKVWDNLSKQHERETLFDFISLVEELIYFLGRDRLNAI